MISKTNWTASDYYSYEDFARVVNNQLEVKAQVEAEVGGAIAWNTIDLSKTIPYLETINSLESNIDTMQHAIATSWTTDTVTWYALKSPLYVRNPDYSDWNRWEAALLEIVDRIHLGDAAEVYSGEFYSGEV